MWACKAANGCTSKQGLIVHRRPGLAMLFSKLFEEVHIPLFCRMLKSKEQ